MDSTGSATSATDSQATDVASALARLTEKARVDAVFGEPRVVGQVTVIPCAEIMAGGGRKPAGRRLPGDDRRQAGQPPDDENRCGRPPLRLRALDS